MTQQPVELPELKFRIGAHWIGTDAKREVTPIVNPATGDRLGMVPKATFEDLEAALEAAESGFKTWKAVSAYDRAVLIRKASSLIREREDRIATLLTLEEGKTLQEARLEIRAAADTIDWYADEGRRAYGRIIPPRMEGQLQLVLREPVGPVAAFSPWNFPALTPARKIAASVAAGCSCIIKPSEETPYTCFEFVKAFIDAGLPDGVLNLVYGVPAEVSQKLISSPIIRKFTFTGSTGVGKQLGKLAAETVTRATLELGGHAPVLIFNDADVVSAANTLVAAKYRNAGQICIAPTRFYIQSEVYDQFVDLFVEKTKNIRVGNGLEASSQMGPLANSRRIEAMDDLLHDAVSRGAKLRTGGQRIGNVGNFYQPTVISEVDEEARIMNDEPFGPIAILNHFDDLEEAVRNANRLPFGLAAYTFTKSSQTAIAVSTGLESGMVGVNSVAISLPEAPFGGVKESGYGSESGSEGLEAFLNTKFITLS